jgi:hypothetical protein
MSDTQRAGGFAGDPAAALSVAGTGGCCGNPPQAALALPDPPQATLALPNPPQATLALPDPAVSASPCCGTAAEATAAGTCCGTAARSDAVAAGAGCCG